MASYWPRFALHGKGAVTVLHALTHRDGFADGLGDLKPSPWLDEEAVASALEELPLGFPPGTASSYYLPAELEARVAPTDLTEAAPPESFDMVRLNGPGGSPAAGSRVRGFDGAEHGEVLCGPGRRRRDRRRSRPASGDRVASPGRHRGRRVGSDPWWTGAAVPWIQPERAA